jgi:dCTP deaminase
MSILCDTEILEEIKSGSIVIKPFNPNALGTNSYDIHLGSTLATYDNMVLDAKKDNPVTYFEIPDEGFILQPGRLYLGVTQEYTETHKHIPFIDGKSSSGRLGIIVHYTAGRGDVGFSNHWTLEISVTQPIKVYKGMPLAQIFYMTVNHEKIKTTYDKKPSAKYNEVTAKPTPSRMHLNQF